MSYICIGLRRLAVPLFAAAISCTAAFSQDQPDSRLDKQGVSERQESSAQQPAFLPRQGVPPIVVVSPIIIPNSSENSKTTSEGYHLNCEKPKNYEEGNLCLQGDMASSARQSANSAWYQALAGGFGLIFVVISLWIARNAAVGARNAAEAADRTARIMDLTAERQLRAYVSITGGNIYVENHSITIAIGLKNFGQTPATNMSNWFSTDIILGSERIDFNAPPAHERPHTVVLAPGNSIKIGHKFEIPLDKIHVLSEIKAGIQYLYAWGETNYQDVFGRQRRSRFKFVAVPNPAGQWELRPTPEANEED